MIDNKLKTLFIAARPPFLILTPVCVFLGFSAALYENVLLDQYITQKLVLVILFGSICAHISVNMLNEYLDFKSGLDLKTARTAFSGGSGALPANPDAAKPTLMMGIVMLIITSIIGIYLLLTRGNLIAPIGIAGVVLIICYTKLLNKRPLLCLLAPGLGFGILMVIGSYVVLTGKHAQLAWLLSVPPFLLINNLLLLNQYPDINVDASIGRKTLPIAYGITISNLVYVLFAGSCYSLIVYYVSKEYIPRLGLIALLPLLCSVYAAYGAVKHGAKIGQFPRYMAANVAASILLPLLLGLGLLLGQ
ncbi:MAG TPA: prenyltransferase [Methylophilaceae bacterium]|nr:prenyltransferase [Methylophilaceae bacterium]